MIRYIPTYTTLLYSSRRSESSKKFGPLPHADFVSFKMFLFPKMKSIRWSYRRWSFVPGGYDPYERRRLLTNARRALKLDYRPPLGLGSEKGTYEHRRRWALRGRGRPLTSRALPALPRSSDVILSLSGTTIVRLSSSRLRFSWTPPPPSRSTPSSRRKDRATTR